MPKYVKEVSFITGLSKIDNLILSICFDSLEDTKFDSLKLDISIMLEQTKKLGIQEEDFFESLVYLKNKYYLTGQDAYFEGKKVIVYPKLTSWGFEQLAKLKLTNYKKLLEDIVILIYNTFENDEYAQLNSNHIAKHMNLPENYTRYLVKVLYSKNLIEVIEAVGCTWIKRIKPEIKIWSKIKDKS